MQGMPNVPGYDNYDNYGIPDFPSESSEEESADPVDLPDIEVIPNKGGIVINPRPNTEELNAKEVYEKVAKSTVAVTASRTGTFDEETSSTGTGIIATSDGYIITNSHVVGDSKSTYVKITTFDEKEYDAIVVGVDRTTDLAVLKTNDY